VVAAAFKTPTRRICLSNQAINLFEFGYLSFLRWARFRRSWWWCGLGIWFKYNVKFIACTLNLMHV
jgi:hypothetical protein